MAQFKPIAVKHPQGAVTIYATHQLAGSDRPVVVFLHGALRWGEMLADWGDLLADVADVVLVDLPGHGASPPIASGALPVLADLLHEVLGQALPDRRVLLVGESFGGTLALAIAGRPEPGPVRAVFAADPPLTMAKQWSVAINFRNYYRSNPEHTYAPVLGRDFFGVLPEGIEERIYYAVLGELTVPAVIASGDTPLLPPRRPLPRPTNVIDDVDRFVMATFYADKVRYAPVTDSGHLLLVDAKAQCQAIIRGLLAEHFAPADASAPG